MKEKEPVLTLSEMHIKRKELLEAYRKLQFEKVIGQIKNPLEIRKTRRKIACLNTKIHLGKTV